MNDLPPNWVAAYVDDIKADSPNALAIGPFGSNLKVSDYRASGVPLVFVRNIRAKSFAAGDMKFVSQAKAESLRAHRVRKGDLLVTKMGEPPGDSAIYPLDEEGIITADCIKLSAHPAINVRYLMYAVSSPIVKRQIVQITQGVAQRKVSLARFRRGVQIPLAPAAEQKRIVAAIDEAFSRIDAGEAGLQRVRRHLGFLRGAVLKALTNPADEWVKLGEIAEVVGGVTKDTKRQADPSYVEAPYLRVANVQRGYLDLGVVTTIRVPAGTVEKLRLEPDDILFNEGGDRDKLGRGWVWEGQVPDCIHQNHVFRARLRTNEFDPKFVSMHGNTFGRTWFETMGKQTTNLASVSLTTLKAFPIPKVPIDEQRRLVAQVEAQTSQIVAFERIVELALRRAAALRSAILSSAFDGHLVSQDPGDEPASILLDRIASERGSSNSHDKATGTRRARTVREEVTA